MKTKPFDLMLNHRAIKTVSVLLVHMEKMILKQQPRIDSTISRSVFSIWH